MQYYYGSNSTRFNIKEIGNSKHLFRNHIIRKSLIIGLILVLIFRFTDGKVFKTEEEKNEIRMDQQIKGLLE
ncbi:hypothetical protein D3C81_2150290 [compost metagenome]